MEHKDMEALRCCVAHIWLCSQLSIMNKRPKRIKWVLEIKPMFIMLRYSPILGCIFGDECWVSEYSKYTPSREKFLSNSKKIMTLNIKMNCTWMSFKLIYLVLNSFTSMRWWTKHVRPGGSHRVGLMCKHEVILMKIDIEFEVLWQ